MAWDGVPDLGGGILKREEVACFSCDLRSYKVGGALRCVDWRRWRTITRCLKYRGNNPEKFAFSREGEKWIGK